jgi:hypothetical protein
VLDRQLREEQNTSIEELNAASRSPETASVPRVSRMDHLQLPPISFYQLRVAYQETEAPQALDTPGNLAALDPSSADFRTQATVTTRFLDDRHAADNEAFGVVRDTAIVSEQFGRLATLSSWLNDIVRESLGYLAAADLRPYRDVLRDLFARITYVDHNLLRYNTLFDQSAIRSAVRLAFHVHRELHSREEVVRCDASLLLVESLKSIPPDAGLWPDQAACDLILKLDPQPPAPPPDPALVAAKKLELQKVAADFGNPDLAEMWLRQWLATANRDGGVRDLKERTLHYLPYAFRQSAFEQQVIDQALRLDAFKEAGLEIYYNGERNLTAFRIECYSRTNRAWRREGWYTPDFLILRRDAARDIRKVLILETKGSGYAHQPAFVARRRFMQDDFLRLNNEKFGYPRFDFLMLYDDAPLQDNLATLATRINTFFTEDAP